MSDYRAALIERVKAGERVSDAAEALGVSRSTAYTALRAGGVRLRPRRTGDEARRHRDAIREARRLVRFGASPQEAAETAGIPVGDVPPRAGGAPGRTYTDHELTAAMLAAAGDGGTLTASAYADARQPGWPSTSIIIVRFGSWRAATEAAGLSSGRQGRSSYQKAGRDDILPALVDFLESGETAIRQWQKQGRSPCSATVTRAFGSWGAAMSAAWEARS